MKQLHLIFLTLFLLLGQWSSLEHDYHDHESGEICDYCLNAQPLDHAVTNSVELGISNEPTHQQDELAQEFISKSNIRYYSVRAPPRFI